MYIGGNVNESAKQIACRYKSMPTVAMRLIWARHDRRLAARCAAKGVALSEWRRLYVVQNMRQAIIQALCDSAESTSQNCRCGVYGVYGHARAAYAAAEEVYYRSIGASHYGF